MEDLHLIVGLGNPGREYAQTRHNAGFMVVDRLGERWGSAWSIEKRFESQVARGTSARGRRVFLAKPMTFMNASGRAVAALASYFGVDKSKLLVVVDDADLAFGTLRMRPDGSSGGHHGLESIEQHVGGKDYARLRVGIGRRGAVREITGHVLGRFESTEAVLLDKVLAAASNQAECWVDHGTRQAMNQFNGTLEDPANEGIEK